jgi:hypothetical protein
MCANKLPPITDEMLMAFADGELEGEEAARIESAIEGSPELLARVEMFLTSRLKAQNAFRTILTEPVPDRLLKTVMGADVPAPAAEAREGAEILPFDRVMSRAGPKRGWTGIALAASIAAIFAAGAAGFLVGRGNGVPANAMAGLLANEKSIAGLLTEAPDGARRDLAGQLSVSVSATYRAADQSLCRAIDVMHPPSTTAAKALACHGEAGWTIAGALPASRSDGLFRPAGAGVSIETLLDAAGASEALPAAEVEALIRKGWR